MQWCEIPSFESLNSATFTATCHLSIVRKSNPENKWNKQRLQLGVGELFRLYSGIMKAGVKTCWNKPNIFPHFRWCASNSSLTISGRHLVFQCITCDSKTSLSLLSVQRYKNPASIRIKILANILDEVQMFVGSGKKRSKWTEGSVMPAGGLSHRW